KWKTKCTFSYTGVPSNESVNLHVLSNVNTLIGIYSFLLVQDRAFKDACKELSVDAEFQWQGHSLDAWTHDIKTRIDQIMVIENQKKLDSLQKRLDVLISPELRAKLEIEQIQKELGL